MSVATPSASNSRPSQRLQARPAQPITSSSRIAAAKPVAARPAPKANAATGSTLSIKGAKPAAAPSASSAPSTSFHVPGKDTSSSAGRVYAKPSKEWVLPERAKPGRKVAVEEPDSTRASQNRQSQRAHRARRTDYISTLEERIRQFENDEIHSNVRLQEVARALKADNERLKAELLARPSAGSEAPKGWEGERRVLSAEVKSLREEVRRLRDREAARMEGSAIPRGMTDRGGSMSVTPRPSSPRAQSVAAGIRHIADCPICPDPDPDCPCQKIASSSLTAHYGQHSHIPDPSLALGSTLNPHVSPPPAIISCGYCQSTDECLCRMIDETEDVKPVIVSPPIEHMPLDGGCGLCTDGGFCACAVARSSPNMSMGTLQPTMEMPAAPAAAVPLRRLRYPNGNPARNAVWALESGVDATNASAVGVTRSEAVCSGDPSNCDACRNDTFGKEFCSNFFQSRDPLHSCTECQGKCSSFTAGPSTIPTSPSLSKILQTSATSPVGTHPFDDTSSSAPLLMACCGSPGLCGHQTGGCTGDVIGIGGLIPGLAAEDIPKETIRVDQAWKTLKAHPNAKFASLAFLADVVAQRAGPSMGRGGASSPLSVGAGPSGGASPAVRGMPSSRLRVDHTGPEIREGTSVRDEANAKRQLVVEPSALRDALRVLDTTSAPVPVEGSTERAGKRARLA